MCQREAVGLSPGGKGRSRTDGHATGWSTLASAQRSAYSASSSRIRCSRRSQARTGGHQQRPCRDVRTPGRSGRRSTFFPTARRPLRVVAGDSRSHDSARETCHRPKAVGGCAWWCLDGMKVDSEPSFQRTWNARYPGTRRTSTISAVVRPAASRSATSKIHPGCSSGGESPDGCSRCRCIRGSFHDQPPAPSAETRGRLRVRHIVSRGRGAIPTGSRRCHPPPEVLHLWDSPGSQRSVRDEEQPGIEDLLVEFLHQDPDGSLTSRMSCSPRVRIRERTGPRQTYSKRGGSPRAR